MHGYKINIWGFIIFKWTFFSRLSIFNGILLWCVIPLKTIPNIAKVHDVPCLSPHYKSLSRTLFEILVYWLTNKTVRTLYKSLFDFEFHDRTSLYTGMHNKNVIGGIYYSITINFSSRAKSPIHLLHTLIEEL